MVARARPRAGKKEVTPRRVTSELPRSQYFVKHDPTRFFSSGCTLLDCAMGHGYPVGKVVNIIGDKSTGKTQLAIEAFANFSRRWPGSDMVYHEVEAAFDEDYAGTLGAPVSDLHFIRDVDTVEGLFDSMKAMCDRRIKAGVQDPALYIIDSMDALSSKEEKKRKFDEATYGQERAKAMSRMFRILVRDIWEARMSVFFISQIRDKIGVTFGRKWTRSGGRALDFYSSMVLVLADIGDRHKTIEGVKRSTGRNIRLRVDKNKVANPHHVVDFPIVYQYGIDDVRAGVEWLLEVKKRDVLDTLGIRVTSAREGGNVTDLSIERALDKYPNLRADLSAAVQENYAEISEKFAPKRQKYDE